MRQRPVALEGQASWHDHPDHPALFRYWDGVAWTEDICPKPKGWLTDLALEGRRRYWDGECWTNHVVDADGRQYADSYLPNDVGGAVKIPWRIVQGRRRVDKALVAVAATLGGTLQPSSWKSAWKKQKVVGTSGGVSFAVTRAWGDDDSPGTYTFGVLRDWHSEVFRMNRGIPPRSERHALTPVKTGDEYFDLMVQTKSSRTDLRSTFSEPQWAMIVSGFMDAELSLYSLSDSGANANSLPFRTNSNEVAERAVLLVNFFCKLTN